MAEPPPTTAEVFTFLPERFRVPEYVDLVRYDQPYVPSLTDDPVQMVRSKMGSGKTECLIRWINQHKISSVLLLSTRRKFARSMVARLRAAEINVTNYMDVPRNRREILYDDYLMISAESLWRAGGAYELVVMDEITSFLAQMNSPHHRGNLGANRMILERSIRAARFIIALDADIDERVCRFLHEFRPDDRIKLQWNDRAYDPEVEVHEFTDHDRWKALLFDYVRRGKNIHVTHGVKGGRSGAIRLHADLRQEFPDLPMVLYSGSNDIHERDFEDVNSSWQRYRVVIHTSTITVGVDFSAEHFDAQFVYGFYKSNLIRETKQMMGRVRRLRDRKIFAYISEGMPRLPLNRRDICDRLERQQVSHQLFTNQQVVRYFDDGGHRIWEMRDDIWSWLTLSNLLEQNNSQRNYRRIFRGMVQDMGYRLYFHPVDHDESLLRRFRRLRHG